MTKNDILNNIRNALRLNNESVIEAFAFSSVSVTNNQIFAWSQKEQSSNYVPLNDEQLAAFLDGFIVLKRGKRDAKQNMSEKQLVQKHLNNNQVFQKLRIALNLKADDILHILRLADLHISKHELSAFFRKMDNKHYRECTDQTLQQFFTGYSLLIAS